MGLLPGEVADAFRRLTAAMGTDDLVHRVEKALALLGAPPDPRYDALLALAQSMLENRTVLQVGRSSSVTAWRGAGCNASSSGTSAWDRSGCWPATGCTTR